MVEARHDEKGKASLTLSDVIRQTANNYPDTRFRPKVLYESPFYRIAPIDPTPYSFWSSADGIGTKPELAERLYADSVKNGIPQPEYFSGLAFDTLAMIDGDAARFGLFLPAVTNVIDINSAQDTRVVAALAQGLQTACDAGHFALLNGETAELGYCTSGYGNTRINWNADGKIIANPAKLLTGEALRPGQPLVALREESIRSNGLSKARRIVEAVALSRLEYASKEAYLFGRMRDKGIIFDEETILADLNDIFGHDVLEQVLVPWHQTLPDVTKQLLKPSRLYGPLMYAAQGGVDGERNAAMTGAAHISGGGVPEKGIRMVETTGLGLAVDAVFPDPEAVTSLLSLADELPDHIRHRVGIDDRTACEQWNRGIGFLIGTEDKKEAQKLVDLASENGYEAQIAGEVIDKPEVQFREHTWTYQKTA